MLNFCYFIPVFIFTTNHHLKCLNNFSFTIISKRDSRRSLTNKQKKKEKDLLQTNKKKQVSIGEHN